MFRRELLMVALFSLVLNLLMLSPTLYMLQVFDRVMVSQNEFTLLASTLILVLFVAMMAMAEWVRSRLLVRAGVRFDSFLNERVFNASFKASLDRAGDNPTQSFGDLTNLRQFLTGAGVFSLFDTPWTLIYIAVLFLMHPMLGWFGVAFLLLLTIVAWVGHRLTSPGHIKAAAAAAQAAVFLAAKLRNAESVQAMGMLGHLRGRWLQLHMTQLAAQQDALHRTHRVTAFTKFVQYCQQSIVLTVGAWLVIHGELSAGAMVAANALMTNALRPISTLVGTWKQFVDAHQAYMRLQALFEKHPERKTATAPQRLHGQIQLRGLVAKAQRRPLAILKGLDVDFPAGEVIAIVGPSGAGKSTLAACLTGIWQQCEGDVLLDGKPLREWSRESLGPHIGYLPQHIDLLDGTVAEYIARFGTVDSACVIEAAQRAGVHEMILRLPMGYDTPMGQAGSQFSGGQRQRLALARALHGNPVLVVLDEPTANLDDVGISALTRAVRDLKDRGATVFMVLHQHNLLALADRVLHLEDGLITRYVPVVAETRTTTPAWT
jgi:ATP-binding cassette subfamily C exporter for protease/lipase